MLLRLYLKTESLGLPCPDQTFLEMPEFLHRTSDRSHRILNEPQHSLLSVSITHISHIYLRRQPAVRSHRLMVYPQLSILEIRIAQSVAELIHRLFRYVLIMPHERPRRRSLVVERRLLLRTQGESHRQFP